MAGTRGNLADAKHFYQSCINQPPGPPGDSPATLYGMTRQEAPSARSTAVAALAVTILLAVAKLIVWGATGSLAVLSQALDSVLDIAVLGLLYVGLRVAEKPADPSHHYGHAKAENLVAFTQTLILALIACGVGYASLQRLSGRQPDIDAPWYALALLAGSVVVDGVRAWALARGARRSGSQALGAGALNIATDVATAGVALVSLLFVRAGIERADAIGGLLVAAAVLWGVVRLGRRSVDVLMDRAPEARANEIVEAIGRVPGVSESKRVRVRSAGDRLFADVTVAAGRTTSLERAHDISEAVEREIEEAVPGVDVVVHVEPIAETGALNERVAAAASKVPGVTEVHNVSVHAFDEGGSAELHATLHAKVGGGTSLKDAHDISDLIEDAVSKELDSDVRVDTHIEPLQQTAHGRDVTGQRDDLVRSVKALATQEPDVLDCHEVLITSTDEELSALLHVHARGDLPLVLIHGASERIEKAIHTAHPEVGAVLIHFEPT